MRLSKENLIHIIEEEIEKMTAEEKVTQQLQEIETDEEQKAAGKSHEQEDYSEDFHTVQEGNEKIEEVTPPGREKQVKTLKKSLPKTYTDPKTGKKKESSPYAVSWASYKKSKSE